MRHLFVEPEALLRDPVVIEGPDHHHLANVLRVRAGERLHLLDGEGGSWEAEVVEVGRRSTSLKRSRSLPAPPEPARRVIIAQALGKGDRFEQAIQHATEAGASGFIPLMTERGVSRLDADDLLRKGERWQRVLKGAAEQSGRAAVPALGASGTVAEVVRRYAGRSLVLLLDAAGVSLAEALGAADAGAPVLFMVGPEGGFTPDEVAACCSRGGTIASLGAFILRTEAAGVFATAQALYAAQAATPVLESPVPIT